MGLFNEELYNRVIGGNFSDATQVFGATSEMNRLSNAKNARELKQAMRSLEETIVKEEYYKNLGVICYGILSGNSMGLTNEEQKEALEEMIEHYKNNKEHYGQKSK